MEQIIINKPSGAIVPMQNKRTITKIVSAKQSISLLGEDVVRISIRTASKQDYNIGDRIVVFGRAYELNRLPKVDKIGMHEFMYELEFEGVQYGLARATYDLTIDTTNNQLQDVQGNSLTGDLKRFGDVLISNANRVTPGKWKLGECPKTIEDKTLTFGESDNCLSVVHLLCKEFDLEYNIEQNNGVYTLNFKKTGQILPYTFQYGKGKGLYALSRQNVSSANIITRLKVYGSSSNITNKYRADRLCLSGKSKGQSYIEKADAVANYGIWEATKYFEDVKPSRTGKITSIDGTSVLKFVDSTMFDLNTKEADGKTTKYLIDGVSAKIHFNTGNLAGYAFDVHSYDHAKKTFTLVKLVDERGEVFPSSTSQAFQFKVGDEYKILDVALPHEYEVEAEKKLQEKGDEYYEQNSQPKVEYNLAISPSFLQKIVGSGTTGNLIMVGDYVPIKDEDIKVDKSVRVRSFTRDLLNEYDYSLTISDTVTSDITNRVISELNDIDKVITINNLKDPSKARRDWRSAQEVLSMVFDPEGDYYTEKIKPESIETLALSVGAKSMQFGLTNTVLQPNFNGNKNLMKVQGGVLTHYTIDNEKARSWNLADNETAFNKDTDAYYIYARCQRVGTAGAIIFSIDQIKTEQDPNNFHFWIGIVNSVDKEVDARSVALSYGFTMINGKFIKTGRIESSDGQNYFDLDANQMRLGDSKSAIEWNKRGDGKLKIKGSVAVSSSGDESPIEVDRGDFNDKKSYYIGDKVWYNGIAYSCTKDNPFAVIPTNSSYWKPYAPIIGSRNFVLDSKHKIKRGRGFMGWELSDKTPLNGVVTLSFDAIAATGSNESLGVRFAETIDGGGGAYFWLPPMPKGRNHNIKTFEIERTEKQKFICIYSNDSTQLDVEEINLVLGNKSTTWMSAPEDLEKQIDKAQDDAKKALDDLTDIASDNKLTPSEKPNVSKEMQIIRSEVPIIVEQAKVLNVNTINYVAAFNNLNNYVTPLLVDWTVTTDILGSLFRANFQSYYNEKTTLLKNISEELKNEVDNIEVGGVNLISGSNSVQVVGGSGGSKEEFKFTNLYADLVEGEEYTFQCKTDGTWGTVNGTDTVEAFLCKDKQYLAYFGMNSNPKTFKCNVGGRYWIRIDSNKGSVKHKFWEFQVEKGNKATDWRLSNDDVQKQIEDAKAEAEALAYLKEALANRTEIDGGLLLTSLLKLGVFNGNTFLEKAGINGTAKNNNDVIAWFGGTLQQAIQNLAGIVFRLDGSGQLAKGNINWNALGELIVKGKFESSDNEGNKIILDASKQSVQQISKDGNVIGRWEYGTPKNVGERWRSEIKLDSREKTAQGSFLRSDVSLSTATGLAIHEYNTQGDRFETAYFSMSYLKANRIIIFKDLPTSANRLVKNQLWNDNGVLKIVQ